MLLPDAGIRQPCHSFQAFHALLTLSPCAWGLDAIQFPDLRRALITKSFRNVALLLLRVLDATIAPFLLVYMSRHVYCCV